MPITQERENIQDLRAAGFTENQAVTLAAKLEAAAHSTEVDVKSVVTQECNAIRQEMTGMGNRLDSRIESEANRLEILMDKRFAEQNSRIAEVEARFERTMRTHLITIVGTIFTAVGATVALLKLFPPVH